jgi:hypothetical protein
LKYKIQNTFNLSIWNTKYKILWNFLFEIQNTFNSFRREKSCLILLHSLTVILWWLDTVWNLTKIVSVTNCRMRKM